MMSMMIFTKSVNVFDPLEINNFLCSSNLNDTTEMLFHFHCKTYMVTACARTPVPGVIDFTILVEQIF